MKIDNPEIILFNENDLLNNSDELAELLYLCVHQGASISFILPFNKQDSKKYWLENLLPRLTHHKSLMLVAKLEGKIAGTVQLDLDTPANQPHRAEISKLLVSPHFQRRGIAKKLMLAIEQYALTAQRSLLTLDTRTGDKAEPLYLAMGYEIAGVIPNFARDPIKDKYDATTLMFKQLSR